MAFDKTLVEELIGSYSELNSSDPTSFIIKSYDGEHIEKCFVAVCHMSLRNCDRGLYHELITAVPRTDGPSLEYLQALIQGPFRHWQDYISLVCQDHHYYLYLSDLSKIPAQVVYNFCIASRVPIEFPNIIKKWGELVEKGIHQDVALCVSSRVITQGNKMGSIITPGPGHWWYNHSHRWKRILLGQPRITSGVFTGPDPMIPTNSIWDDGSLHEARIESRTYLTMTIPELDTYLRKEYNLR